MNKQELIEKWEDIRDYRMVEGSAGSVMANDIVKDLNELKEPEALSQDGIAEHRDYCGSYQIEDGEYYISVKVLEKPVVPSKRDQLEEAYEDIMSRKEFWFDGKQYKVVEVSKEETVVSVPDDFYKVLEQVQKVLSMEVDTNG